MNPSTENSSQKRKREEPAAYKFLSTQDRAVLSVIKNKKDAGIFKGHIKYEAKLIEREVTKSLKTLVQYNFVKEVVNVKKSGKHYMAEEFEPCSEISGGDWYEQGKLDTELIGTLSKACSLATKKASTFDSIYDRVKRIYPNLTKQQAVEILNLMVLSNEVIEVKSTGIGDFVSVPIGTICYKNASAAGLEKGPNVGAFASIPCGACPRISECTPHGVISPSTCVYYTKWLDISF